MKIIDEIKSGKILLCDGAWGTLLQTKGLKTNECPESWNLTHKDEIYNIAKSYADAGSDIIETNSFGANYFSLKRYNLEDKVSEINRLAASISHEAAENQKYVAGSIGPTGKMLFMNEVTEDEIYNAFKEQAIALEQGGADIIIIETMTALDEAILALQAAKQNTKCTTIVTMTFNKTNEEEYRTMMGVSPAEMTKLMIAARANIIGANCGNGIEDMIHIVKEIRKINKNVPVIIQPNAGLPEFIESKTIYKETPEMMASYIPELIKVGVNIFGGCCGTTPEHIKEFRKVINNGSI
jgi:5-methyltetrahydrofolate--homocysteine methyltransferase